MSAPKQADSPFCRTPVVELDGLVSSYPETAEYKDRKDVGEVEHTDWAVEDLALALKAVQRMTILAGGRASITEVGRSFAVSAAARQKYLKGEKHAYVAPPGSSMHNGGQAVDFWVYDLQFADVPKDQWLERFWDIAIPQGFTPIIKVPSLSISECWHFDWRGPWQDTYDWFKQRQPSQAYSQMARCAILDAGLWELDLAGDPEEDAFEHEWMEWAYIQAQLHRIGLHSVGAVDGIPGKKTKNALSMVQGVGFTDERMAIASMLNQRKTGAHVERD